ncbi:hypothetical protein BMS3Abin07_01126 [bacterium BMS3Abin07]|nr:hypothetical protein BMS3Abin07_01126 [bacterium BMS3Abin07]GBE31599.1 hypothetical protein BMS3Bbin05_00502 [bacterium BMS3Bbin05]
MINITLALMADYANVTREGKLNIMGIFENIHVQTFPATHPQMQLVMSLVADRRDCNKEHKLEIELLDADGNKVFSIGGQMRIPTPPAGQQARMNHIIQLNNLAFNKHGDHEFKIIVNGEVRKSVPLTVTKIKK